MKPGDQINVTGIIEKVQHGKKDTIIMKTEPESIRRFHELVLINGTPEIGEGTKIGIFSEVYDSGGIVKIGKNCDIASFVAINCADSHCKTLGLSEDVELLPIVIGDNVFIGTHSAILGGCVIGHHSVIGAGVILPKLTNIPPYSQVLMDRNWNNLCINEAYYKE